MCDKCVYYSACDYEDENDGDTCDYFKRITKPLLDIQMLLALLKFWRKAVWNETDN